MRRMKTYLLWNWFWKITTESMLFRKEKLPIPENGVQLGKIHSPLLLAILSNCSTIKAKKCHLILIALLFHFRGLGWFTRVCLHLHGCHILDLQRHWTVSIYHRKKYERVFFHLDVGIELNCEPITRNYQRIGSDLVVENLAVAGCLGAACDCWVGIVATSNSQNWGLEGGGVPTLTLAALFPAAGSLTWTREENHLVRRRGWQDKIR